MTQVEATERFERKLNDPLPLEFLLHIVQVTELFKRGWLAKSHLLLAS